MEFDFVIFHHVGRKLKIRGELLDCKKASIRTTEKENFWCHIAFKNESAKKKTHIKMP